jgi:glycosyltransferase involved in cell wall biosynthesis
VRSLAGGLATTGHEVAIACGERPETPADLRGDLPADVALHRLPWHRRTLGAQIPAGRALRRLVREWAPDLVHLHSSFAGALGAVAVPRGPALVYTPHSYASARAADGGLRVAGYRAAERLIARRCDLVGAVSEAEAVLAREVARARRVAIVRNGIPELDPGAEPGASPRPERPLVVAAGRIGPQRRPAETARILAALTDLADLAWIGAAPRDEDAPLRAAGVRVTGWLPRAETLAALGAATVYVHWSAWDGLSLALLEALAHDAVVVASDIAANREVVGASQVCSTEAEAIAVARAVLEDPALREELLARQRERRRAFGATRMTSEWEAVYTRLLDPAQPRRTAAPRVSR